MRVRPIFAWYDLWVGAFWDAAKRRLYVFPVPTLGLVFDWGPPPQPVGEDPVAGLLQNLLDCRMIVGVEEVHTLNARRDVRAAIADLAARRRGA